MTTKLLSETIREQMEAAGKRFWASDNVSDFVDEAQRKGLIEEATGHYEKFLDALLIDRKRDPNSLDTGKRVAKMYINELMSGRFDPAPPVTAFPNDEAATRYEGILLTKNPIKSVCSHHHQPVSGTCWVGVIPGAKVIGLSKYGRQVQHLSRRGTLQEELARQILETVKHDTQSNDVGVVIIATHGCCTNRGLMNPDSSTITSLMSGQFFSSSVRDEFMQLISNHKNLY